ncbi:MAG: hypothetical protein RLP09_21550 [Sandaracinaceae bacterium]
MRRLYRPCLLALSLALWLLGCASNDTSLIVDLRTDLVPGYQFTGITTVVRHAEGSMAQVAEEREFALPGEDYLSGVRIAQMDGVPTGSLAVEVTLYDMLNVPVISRTVVVRLAQAHAVTVLITDSCRDVTCPGAGDDPSFSACVGGRCVDPRCSPETPEFCGDGGCSSDGECTTQSACARPMCIAEECFAVADDSACAANELCDLRAGCVLRPDVDAGPGCPSTETSCADGVDDDCDGQIDCADSDCLDVSCDDGSVCTENDVCQMDGTCGGDALDCDDGEPCTDDSCDPTTGCAHTNNTASCDDGFWCNGADSCRDGACQDHGEPPCPSFCNEMTMACEECRDDADCGSVSFGGWSGCGGFSGTCDETGTQSRTVTTPRCMAGVCSTEVTMESRSCARTTEDTTCGSTTYSGWGSCGGYSNACDQTGTQSRTRTRRLCRSGSCANVNNSESRGCSRTVSDGTSCGGTWSRCCGGVCRDLRTNGNCGGCGVNCNAIGLSCANTGTGGYSCRGCSTNASCQSILNGSATCYNVAAPPAWCQCQCSGNGVCSNGGCGAGMFCHDCPGTNFCAPFGGSC